MGSSYTNTWRKENKRQKRLKLLAYGVIFAFTAIAITNTVQFIRSSDNTAAEKNKYADVQLEKLTQPNFFRKAYQLAHGSHAILKDAHSICIKGEIHTDSISQPFMMIKKRPDKLLIKFEQNSQETTITVTGDTVWRRDRGPLREEHCILIKGREAEQWLAQRHFFDPIIRAIRRSGHITAIEISEWQETPCLKTTIEDSMGAILHILIDPQTMYPIARLDPLPDKKIKQTVYSDYRNVDGIPIPFLTTTSTNNQVIRRTQVHSAKLNAGVLSNLFDLPESLRVQN